MLKFMINFGLKVGRFWETPHHKYKINLLFLCLHLRDELLYFTFYILE